MEFDLVLTFIVQICGIMKVATAKWTILPSQNTHLRNEACYLRKEEPMIL